MATVSGDPSQPLAVGSWAVDDRTASKSERYLAKRLAAAGADYKGVALTTFLLAVGVVGLAWLAVGVLAEHWVVPGGLPRWARWTWLALGAASLAAGIVRWIVPLIRCRVNLVYAARSIEREYPDLHNDLVNAVLVKSNEDATSERMVRSLKRRAARWLSGVPANEAVVDRTAAVRLACAVAALVGVACLYEVLAPKSLLTTAARLVAPWTNVAAPSRVQISPIHLRWRMPGDGEGDAAAPGHEITIESAQATLVRGRQLVVAAEIRGLRRGEQPTLTVRPLGSDGSADLTARPWQAVMERHRGGDGHGFITAIPDARRGLDQSLELSLAAGDGRSDPVKVVVIDAPSLLVREVHYDYPAYTRQPPEIVRWQGDIRAVEGTKVTIVAAGNRALGAAWIDFGCDGRRDKPLKVKASDPTQASVTFDLRSSVNGAGPDHRSYGLLFEPREAAPGGSAGMIADPLQHRIDIVADVAPEITIEEPRESPLRVPPDAPVRVRVRAVDPDFGLVRVGIETRVKNGGQQKEMVLLSKEKSGPFEGATMLVPRQMGVAAGGTLEYRGVAIDTRPDSPNVTRTEWQALIIDPSAAPREPTRAPDEKERDRNESQPEGGSGNRDADEPRSGSDSAEPDRKPTENPDKNQDKSQDKSQEKNQGDPETGDAKAGDQKKNDTADDPKAGEKKNSGKESGGKESGGKESGGKESGGKESGGKESGGKESGGKESGGKESGGKESGGKESGGKENGGKENGDTRGDGRQSGGPSGQKQSGKNAGDKKAGGEKAPRESVAADGTNDGEAMERILEHRRQQNGMNQNGQRQSGQKQNGDQPEGDQKSGQKQGGQKQGGQQNNSQQQEKPPCAGADGKPCGKQGCSSCSGGSKSGGGAAGSGAGESSGQAGEERSGEPGQPGADGTGSTEKDNGGGDQKNGRAQEGKSGETSRSAGQKGSQSGEPGGEQAGGGTGQNPEQQGQPGEAAPGGGSRTGAGAVTGGDGAPHDDLDAMEGDQQKKELEWGDEDVAHARNAADLAVEHLRDSVEAGRSDVLRELGWTPEQARAFIERWQAMRRLADSPDQRKRGEFERAVRSLGLRPGGTRSSRDLPSDVKGGQAEGRRSRPPSEYREQVRAYLQGTSGE